MYPYHVFDLEPAGTFGMYPICYWWVSGGYIQPEPAMYSRCFCWFPGPLAPSVNASALLLRIQSFVAKVRSISYNVYPPQYQISPHIGLPVWTSKEISEEMLRTCRLWCSWADPLLCNTLGLMVWCVEISPWIAKGTHLLTCLYTFWLFVICTGDHKICKHRRSWRFGSKGWGKKNPNTYPTNLMTKSGIW